ncbi:MAG: DUF3037 domain-containing protein [Chloroflexi bacterium]|nr:DUF3037 domain-containing protein [Chloroflexota bacterium]
MAENLRRQGYFSILRWRRNPTRDEAKNIGVVLVDPEGGFAGIRKVPQSALPKNLREQGMLGDLLEGFEQRFESESPPDLKQLQELNASLVNALVLTEPRVVLVRDKDETLDALYKAYVQSATGYSSPVITKGALRRHLTQSLSRRGYEVSQRHQIGGFVFDTVIADPRSEKLTVAEVLSFANSKQAWIPEVHDAGHFLFALQHVDNPSLAVVEPPTKISLDVAIDAHRRVMTWFEKEHVEVVGREDFENGRFPMIN